MQNVDYSKTLTSIQVIVRMLSLAREGTYTKESLVKSISKLMNVRLDSAANTVSLLVASSLLIVSPEGICQIVSNDPEDIKNRLIDYLDSEGVLQQLSVALDSDGSNTLVKVDILKLFPTYRGVLPLVTSLDIFSYEVQLEAYVLTNYGQKLLSAYIFDSSFNAYDDGITPDQLNKKLELQAKRGNNAEEYVLSLERRRLSGHAHFEAIKRISLTNVSAGFDIQSFESMSSAALDRFIEVKSFLGSPGFYWSMNEISFAKQKGDSYVLLIVDSEKINDEDYEPTEIKNPYVFFNMNQVINLQDQKFFNIEATSFFISWKDGSE